MADICLRPGCTNSVQTIGVCLGCANSDYEPKEDGIQYRDIDGRFVNTGGLW